MKDYNKYINFLNDNLNNNLTNPNINIKFVKIFYEDINESYVILNKILKKKEYTINILKNKKFNIQGYYFPNVFKKDIDLCIYTISYSFKIDERNITINFNTENNNMNYIFNCFKQAYSWLHIVNKYGTPKCSKKLTINIFLLKYKKELPLLENEVIDTKHVNTAYASVCAPNGEIVIYRKEEWFKVFIHETFHAYGLDFGIIENNKISSELLKVLKIKSNMYVFETYTETWATLWHIAYKSYEIHKNMNITDFYNFYIYYLSIEQIHSIIQSMKILDHMNLSYNDLFSTKNNYRENTNVFNYYILKTIMLYNCNEYIYFFYKHNNKLLNFKLTPNNVTIFIHFIIKLIINNKTMKMFQSGERLYKSGKKLNNYFLNKSLRMTIS
jgi:hypothetical protein